MNLQNRTSLAVLVAAGIASAIMVSPAVAQTTAAPSATAPTAPTTVASPATTPSPDPAVKPSLPPAVPPSPTANTTVTVPSVNPAVPTTNTVTPAPGEPSPPGSIAETAQFAKLDLTHKGYLNRVDVASNTYLSANFQRCDSNGDGRLSESEVSICTQGMPSSKQ